MSLLNLSLLLSFVAAPHPNYGGQLQIQVLGESGDFSPTGAHSLAERTLAASIYESLFSFNSQGELRAELVHSEYTEGESLLRLRLRDDVFLHNGRRLRVQDVIASLASLAKPSSLAKHVIWPIKGGRARSLGNTDAVFGVRAGVTANEIIIDLVHPYPPIKALLAGLQSAIHVDALGTGPFFIEQKKRNVFQAFNQHHRGAPYLASLKVKRRPSAFSLRSALRRSEAQLAFGLADIDSKTAKNVSTWNPALGHVDEVVVLRLGPQLVQWRTPASLQRLSQSIKRRRLSRRFLPGRSKPASNFLGSKLSVGHVSRQRRDLRSRTLLLADEGTLSLRFAEQVQFNLLRAGVSVKIKRVSSEEIDARKQDGNYDFLLESISIAPKALPNETGDFHRLLELAARLSILDAVITPKQMSEFALSEKPKRMKLLAALDKKIMATAATIPIATRETPVWISKAIRFTANGLNRSLRFEDMELRR